MLGRLTPCRPCCGVRACHGQRCVDCQANNPQWASVSFGALLCLECSGKHRGLGVHISFVRSVQMDSWSAKQIKMMEVCVCVVAPAAQPHHTRGAHMGSHGQVGGNGKLRQWFEKHGVLDLPTSDKYNTPEAELYRERCVAPQFHGNTRTHTAHRAALLVVCRILALREGRKPPTKLAEPRTSASSASSGRSAAPAASRPPPGETPVERELRLRREAGERLRAKFGDKGLKGTFVTNSPMAMGGGGNTTSNNGTPYVLPGAGWRWLYAPPSPACVFVHAWRVVARLQGYRSGRWHGMDDAGQLRSAGCRQGCPGHVRGRVCGRVCGGCVCVRSAWPHSLTDMGRIDVCVWGLQIYHLQPTRRSTTWREGQDRRRWHQL